MELESTSPTLYYKTTVIKTILAQRQKYRSMEQNRKFGDKSTPMDTLSFDKGSKNIQWRKDSLFNKWYLENWSAMFKRMKLGQLLTLHTKINSKWIKDLDVRPETIKLSDKTLSDSPPRVMEIKK